MHHPNIKICRWNPVLLPFKWNPSGGTSVKYLLYHRISQFFSVTFSLVTIWPKSLRESFLNIVYNSGMLRPVDVNFFSCSSVDECKDTLIQFGVQDITPAAVARVVGKGIH